MKIEDHILKQAQFVESSHYDERPEGETVDLLVIHNISLPPGEFGSSHVIDFFQGKLNPKEHPFFEKIVDSRVASHLFIRREGEVIQFVRFDKRAFHAGQSLFQGRARCNDFSIGIEMEGTDHDPYTDIQYEKLIEVTLSLLKNYPRMSLDRIVGHSDIAPGRKTDPGASFDWDSYRKKLISHL